jgi:hypothetical protein
LWLGSRDVPCAIAMQRPQSVLSHQAGNSVLAARLPMLTQVQKHSRRTINAVAGCERCTDQSKQSRVLLSSIGDGMLPPCVVACSGHTEQSTHPLDAELVPMRIYELVSSSGLAGALPADIAVSLGYSGQKLALSKKPWELHSVPYVAWRSSRFDSSASRAGSRSKQIRWASRIANSRASRAGAALPPLR